MKKRPPPSVVTWTAAKVGEQSPRRLRAIIIAFVCLVLYFGYIRNAPRGYNWAQHRQRYPIHPDDLVQLPTGIEPEMPIVQFNWTNVDSRFNDAHWEIAETRRMEVVKTFQHAWGGYRKYAFGWDELLPVTGGRRNTFNGWGATLVDSLDTLWLMGLTEDFNAAVKYISKLDFTNSTQPHINLFETNIRYLGGLLGAYDLSGEDILFKKALELGHLLYAAFDTPTRMPMIPWFTPEAAIDGRQQSPTMMSSAAVGTLSMEFTRLTQLTGEPKFYDAIDRIKRFLLLSQETSRIPGMWPMTLDMSTLNQEHGNFFTIGAEADSLYEYLPKMFLLLGGLDPAYETMWNTAGKAINENLVFRPLVPDPVDILVTGSVFFDGQNAPKLRTETGHLSCFAGGMFALAGKSFGVGEHLEVGKRLAAGCAWAYRTFPTGIMPESLTLVPCDDRSGSCVFDEAKFMGSQSDLPKGVYSSRDRRYLLRPEAVESLFIAFRITGEKIYQEMAWEMFQAVRKYTTTEFGSAQVTDVINGGVEDTMESFWLSETLKYFYLIFSPADLISLDEWVFNTEAHPFRRPPRTRILQDVVSPWYEGKSW